MILINYNLHDCNPNVSNKNNRIIQLVLHIQSTQVDTTYRSYVIGDLFFATFVVVFFPLSPLIYFQKNSMTNVLFNMLWVVFVWRNRIVLNLGRGSKQNHYAERINNRLPKIFFIYFTGYWNYLNWNCKLVGIISILGIKIISPDPQIVINILLLSIVICITLYVMTRARKL